MGLYHPAPDLDPDVVSGKRKQLLWSPCRSRYYVSCLGTYKCRVSLSQHYDLAGACTRLTRPRSFGARCWISLAGMAFCHEGCSGGRRKGRVAGLGGDDDFAWRVGV